VGLSRIVRRLLARANGDDECGAAQDEQDGDADDRPDGALTGDW
jgi:hypothetical protein